MRTETITTSPSVATNRRVPSRPWVGIARPADPQRVVPVAAPDPEVPAKPVRRRFTAADKLRILRLVSRGIQFSLVMGIENSLPPPSPRMLHYAMASAPLRRPALIFSFSR